MKAENIAVARIDADRADRAVALYLSNIGSTEWA